MHRYGCLKFHTKTVSSVFLAQLLTLKTAEIFCVSSTVFTALQGKGKGKGHPTTGHEGSDGEQGL